VNRQLGAGYHHALVDRYHETNRIGRTDLETHRPHPEEARSAVSKDGRWLGLACGRPSRRAQSFEARVPSGARAPQDDVRAPQDEVDRCVDMIRTSEAQVLL